MSGQNRRLIRIKYLLVSLYAGQTSESFLCSRLNVLPFPKKQISVLRLSNWRPTFWISFGYLHFQARFHGTFYTTLSFHNSLVSLSPALTNWTARGNGAEEGQEAPFTSPPPFHVVVTGHYLHRSLKGHSQPAHMRNRYHFIANLQIKRSAINTVFNRIW